MGPVIGTAAPRTNAILSVLVVGVCLIDKKNYMLHLIFELSQSRHCIKQRWSDIGQSCNFESGEKVAIDHLSGAHPRSFLINKMVDKECINDYDYVLIVDGDIKIPRGLIDAFFDIQIHYDFALVQSARTSNSWISHEIAVENKSCIARRIRFVEIGPVFSVRKDLFNKIFPIDESSPMGTGSSWFGR